MPLAERTRAHRNGVVWDACVGESCDDEPRDLAEP
jgi:hypothetical protein